MSGMAFGGDYVFSWINFAGLNLSMLGSLIYTKVTLAKSEEGTPKLPLKMTKSQVVFNA